ncbi:MAG TPA: hypothetical protein VGS06_21225 [Streptosporangiaceae bacterium]|nr:hypothetical protein [Streptosporangiaceae bacterium]
MNTLDDAGPLADPVAEARRLIAAADGQGLLLRALGGVAVYLLASDGKPRLPRGVKDIDMAASRGSGRPAARLLEQAGYVGDQMFNALHGSRRLLFIDPAHERHLDVFVGEFSMCHEIPLTARLDRAPLTVPPEELLLSKLQIVEATTNDQSDLYSLLAQYDVAAGSGSLDGSFVAGLCAKDWGLWRTCMGSIERLLANLESSPLDPGEALRVQARLEALRGYLEAAPKTMKWRLRSQVGDKVRWYQQPEEEQGVR